MKSLLNILENLFRENRIISKKEIMVIINEYVCVNGLEAFLKDVRFVNDKNDNKMGFYNAHYYMLVFNIAIICDIVNKHYSAIRKYVNMDYSHYFNFCLLVVVFHELKHIKQYKEMFLVDDDIQDITSWVYEFNEYLKGDNGFKRDYCYSLSSTKLVDKECKTLYDTHYALFPMEREADITAMNQLLSSLYCIDKKLLTKEELKYFQMHFISTLLENYYEKSFTIVSPTQTLLNYVSKGNRGIYENMFKNSHLTLYRRLELGLPIKVYEYDRIEDIYFGIEKGKLPVETDVKSLILKRG